MKLHIIAAALPPQLDGIGDYTANLAAELAQSATVSILTGAASPEPVPGVQIISCFSAEEPISVMNLIAPIAAGDPDWVLLQYNPFSYGRWGKNPFLAETMRRIKHNCPRTRFALMVHEPFVPITSGKNAIMTTWQRWQLWRLGQTADVVFFSVEAWAKRFQKWFPGKTVVHLPVGSNIPRVLIGREEARARLGISPETVVLGLFGMASSGRMMDHVRSAVSALRRLHIPAQVLYIGPHKQQICAALGTEDVIADGPFPAEEVSRRLAAIDIYLVAYIDGISTRRTTLMAALQHGIATVATRGPLTDSIFDQEDGRAFLLAKANDPDGFTNHVVCLAKDTIKQTKIGKQGQQLYEREFMWVLIAQKLYAILAEAKV